MWLAIETHVHSLFVYCECSRRKTITLNTDSTEFWLADIHTAHRPAAKWQLLLWLTTYHYHDLVSITRLKSNANTTLQLWTFHWKLATDKCIPENTASITKTNKLCHACTNTVWQQSIRGSNIIFLATKLMLCMEKELHVNEPTSAAC